MTRIYKHRVNSIEALAQVPEHLGLEFDLRSSGDQILITHDPFTRGPLAEEFFPRIGPRPCIFNVKCEGIEPRVRELADLCGITDYFFLDTSAPAAVKLVRAGERRFAVRYSEFEPIEAALAWAGKAEWVWVDCFEAFPGDARDWGKLSESFKICLVSPELQAHGPEAFQRLKSQLEGRRYDAVCTKDPSLWGAP